MWEEHHNVLYELTFSGKVLHYLILAVEGDVVHYGALVRSPDVAALDREAYKVQIAVLMSIHDQLTGALEGRVGEIVGLLSYPTQDDSVGEPPPSPTDLEERDEHKTEIFLGSVEVHPRRE